MEQVKKRKKDTLGISNFLEEISSLSHSVVFLYFFALTTEDGFLISPCYSLKLSFKWVYLSFSPLPFTSFPFSTVCKASLDNHFAFLNFFFLGMVFFFFYTYANPLLKQPPKYRTAHFFFFLLLYQLKY